MADDLNLRDAGSRIANAGLTDDVKRVSERDIGNRGRRREAEHTQADREDDTRDPTHEEVEDDEEADEAEDDADASREDEGEEGDDDGDSDEAGQDEDPDEGDDEPKAKADDEHEVTVDGKKFKVSTKELVAGYQRSTDYARKTQALADRGRDLTTKHQQVAEHYTRELQRVGAVIGGVRQLLAGDLNSAEMQALRASDPAAWAVARQDFQDRIGKIDAIFNKLGSEHERHAAQSKQQLAESQRATLAQEKEALVRHIPDWDTGGGKRLFGFLGESGFTQEELNSVTDARMLKIAEDARKWRDYQAAKAKEGKVKPKPVQKTVKPGKTQIAKGHVQVVRKQRDFEKDKVRAKKTGDMRDAGKAIARMLG
jgi:hypothetical protein